MIPRRVILDCDPGVDDAWAILLALAAPEAVKLEAITTVVGNVALEQTTANARRVLDLAGRSDVPIFAGCPRPIMAPLVRGASVHGSDGLGDTNLPPPSRPAEAEHAVDTIIRMVRENPGQITLCPIGPLTNIALALIKAPDIAPLIAEIVLMGGSAFHPGNMTPVAEFNFWVDPEAAQIVLGAGVPTMIFGLDVTAQACITESWMAETEARGGHIARAAIAMLRRYGAGDPCLHDPCVIAHLIAPELFSGIDAHVSVELAGGARAQSIAAVSDWHLAGRAVNARVVTELKGEAVFALLAERLISLG